MIRLCTVTPYESSTALRLRDISVGVKETALKVGFLFLMMLMVFVIYNDIARRFTPGLITLLFR